MHMQVNSCIFKLRFYTWCSIVKAPAIMPYRRRGRGRGPGRGRGRGRGRGTEAHFSKDGEDDKATQCQNVAAILKAKGRIKCPKPGCTRNFVNRYGYEYHLERCGVNPEDAKKYYCPLCPEKVYTSKAGLSNHQKTIHERPERVQEQEEDVGGHGQRKAAKKAMAQVKLFRDAISDPTDQGTKRGALKERQREKRQDDFIPEDSESDNDDEEYKEIDDSSVRRKEVKVQSKVNKYDVETFNKMSYDRHCERLCSMQEILFHDLRSKVSTWPDISKSDDMTYDSHVKMNQSHQHVEKDIQTGVGSMTSLPLYSATEIQTEIQDKEDGNLPYFAFNIGGVVRSLAWCPIPISEDRADQYAAFSPYYSNYQVQQASMSQTGPSQTGPTFIQIWGFGPLHNQSGKPDLKFCIVHNAGNVHALKWCPSGCWDNPCDVESSEQLLDNRLGVLAAACSDGCVLIHSIPHPPEGQASSHPLPKVYETVPSLVLWPGRERSKGGSSPGPCLCLDWQQRKPHSKIAAGYSCGLIAIWNVSLQSSTLIRQSNTDGSITLLPTQVFTAHNGPVLTISWSPADNNFMCSSGRNRMLHFWDIHQPGIPVFSQLYPNALHTCQWLSHYSGILTVEDGHIQKILLQDVSSISTPPIPIYCQPTHVLDVTYSEWLNCLVATDISGKIELCEMPRSLPISSKQRIKMVSVRSPCINHASSVLTNMDAIYKLEWNPNKTSCRWLLAGGQSGLVHLYHVPSQVAGTLSK